MKKLITFLFIAATAMSTFAQLTMKASDRTIGKSQYVFLKNGDYGYRVDIKDYRSANLVTVQLGETAQKAQLSLAQLKTWYKEHKVGESVLLNQDSVQLTVYKASPTLLLVSKGSAETCQASYQSMLKTLLVSDAFGVGLIEKTEVVGMLTSTDLNMLNNKIKKEL